MPSSETAESPAALQTREPSRPRTFLTRRAGAFAKGSASTPGRITAFAVLVLAALLVAGVVSADVVRDRQTGRQNLLAEIEPVANASQTLYSSLTVADSAANTAFISGGIEPPAQRGRYLEAIAKSSSALVAATRGLDADDSASLGQLAQLADQLTTYTGLVETARANNRAGNPVASAYLAEASSLMQDTILPSAADLYDRQSSDVGRADRRFTYPTWLSVGLFGVVVLLLALLQRWLSRATGRRLNVGLVLATSLVVIAMLWTLVSGLLISQSISRGLAEGAFPMSELTRQRIAAQKIRAQETLNLVRRTDPEAYAAERTTKLAEVRSTLVGYLAGQGGESARSADLDAGGTVTRAVAALDEWTAAQNRADSAFQQGDYAQALRLSSGQDPGQSGAAFDRLDASMEEAIETARDRLRSRIASASRTAAAAPDVLGTLTTLAAAATIAGVAPRVREYL